MTTLDSKERITELYLPSAEEFVVVDVPELQFAMIDGEGNPNGEAFAQAVKWLFAVVYPIKMIAKQRMGRNFVEPPLEGLWWADDVQDFITGNRDKLNWRIMIVTADWVDDELFDEAVATVKKKRGDAPASLRLDNYDEGKSVQIMHIGPNSDSAATLTKLHQEFLPEHDLVSNGYYHEIYLNDPSRVAPEKLKTVLRQPVRTMSSETSQCLK